MLTHSSTEIKVIAIASSTGGTQALSQILPGIPNGLPPILIVQHMPTGFTKLFADRLNNMCSIDVREARQTQSLSRGCALIAPADYHMRLRKVSNRLEAECYVGQKMHGVMPSADILMNSVADVAECGAIGVVLTGMGADGAEGLLRMRRKGAKTIAQDKDTCIVYGMPRKADELGAAEYILPLNEIADKILSLL